MNLIDQIKIICEKCIELKNKYVSESDLMIDWICIFSQSNSEYLDLISKASKIGDQIEVTESGLIFKLTKKIDTNAGTPKILKIRKYDSAKPEMGDVDFTTEYVGFKKKYIGLDHFMLIKRDKFEMIELMDGEYNVRVYFSSIPPSKMRGIN